MRCLTLTVILLISLVFASGQLEENEIDYFGCEQHTTCGSCLNEDSMCSWCEDETYHLYSQFVIGCSSRERLMQLGCSQDLILSSSQPKIDLMSNELFSDVVDEENMDTVQIRPQKLSLSFSPFEPQNFSFHYRPAKDFSLDLYYLMDLTWSMKDDKETLVKFKDDLGRELKNITKNFRLAFGSFADKPLMPYASMEERRRKNPCLVEHGECERTYDFRHRLNFSEVHTFVQALNSSEITANLDNAEGGMDALMQVLVCGDQMGWNPKSRKIVIFATDGLSHFAGDGVLGGAVKPNDKKCHLNADGYYEHNEMDYPSLEQISRVLHEQKISVIFAATQEVLFYYEQIKNLLPENTFVGLLESDSSNILALIKRGYDYIASVVNFEVPTDEDFEFTVYSNCGDDSRTPFQTSKCTNIKLGETYNFTVDMAVKSNRQRVIKSKKSFVIKESQLGQEILTVEVDMVTACKCSESKSECPTNAEKECGICVCKPGWSGKNCSCNEHTQGNFKNTDGCYPPMGVNGRAVSPCSGKGDCFCDKCQCDQGWDGKFCECSICPINQDSRKVCGGKNRGNCVCGVCACRKGWSGPTCSCSDNLCTSPWNNDLCSGNGVCNCGKCKCTEKGGKNYAGRYCETCSNCNNPACSVYEKCVLNELNIQLSAKEPCISQDGTIFIPKHVPTSFPETSDEQQCVIRIDDKRSKEDGCEYIFTYNVRKDWNTELSIYQKACPNDYQTAGIMKTGVAIVIVMAIVIICLIMWKIYDNLLYQREYRKFQAQKMNDQKKINYVVGNPLYKSPITRFEVPDDYVREHED
ncbi:integrin beta-nu-like isoform X2 [Arctopsyche grandis]|uniref:integrin beta-nu-like isoform X2 n=1 Tax=Arctopsyche grandis TaxID=121162 RepID=UPI00406D7AD7